MNIKHLFRKIKRIIEYIPVLWNNEDWDFEYMLLLMQYKLERIKRQILKDNIIIKSEQNQICDNIDKTLKHINDYLNCDEVYGDFHIPMEYKFEQIENDCSRLITYNANEKRPFTELEEQQFSEYLKKKWEFEQQSWQAIFDTIKEHGQKWWD